MARVCALAICGALIALPSVAEAQSTLQESLRIQAGYTHFVHQEPANDGFIGLVPDLAYVYADKRAQLRVGYTLTANVHTDATLELTHRLALISSFELSRRTGLILAADATQTTIGSELVAKPAVDTNTASVPFTDGRIVATHVGEGTSYEASPVVRLGQSVDAFFATSLDRNQKLADYFAGAGFSADRVWQKDAIGAGLRVGYAHADDPPVPEQKLFTGSFGPQWRHDISRSLTASVGFGAGAVVSPDHNTRGIVRPFLTASVFYFWQDAVVDLTFATGVQPNALTAQLIDADRVTLHAGTPISVRHNVTAGAFATYVHASVINLVRDVPTPPAGDTVITGADIGWSPKPYMQLFARYTYVDQLGGSTDPTQTTTPSVQIHAVVVGVLLTPRPTSTRIRSSFPQRVDGSDPVR